MRGLGSAEVWRACFLAFALNVVGDLVDLVKDIAVAVNEVGDLARRVHNGRVIAAAEGASDLGE